MHLWGSPAFNFPKANLTKTFSFSFGLSLWLCIYRMEVNSSGVLSHPVG